MGKSNELETGQNRQNLLPQTGNKPAATIICTTTHKQFDFCPRRNDGRLHDGPRDWYPKWLQKLATIPTFIVFFAAVQVIQGTVDSYLSSVLGTMQRALAVDYVKTIEAGSSISHMTCILVVTHLGGRSNRPHWIVAGVLVTAASCFTYASLQLLWHNSTDCHDPILDNHIATDTELQPSLNDIRLCERRDGLLSSTIWASPTDSDASSACKQNQMFNVFMAALLFCGQFTLDIGRTTVFTLGMTYMDDNMQKRRSPTYTGVMAAMQLVGVIAGDELSSYCLGIYINPNNTPEYGPEDPRWLGAWWLGFLITGTIQLVLALPIALFPKQLLPLTPSGKSAAQCGNRGKKQQSAWKDFCDPVRRLLQSPIILLQMLTNGLFTIGTLDFIVFLPNYLGAQFRQDPLTAMMILVILFSMILLGMIMGGFAIQLFKPRITYVTRWAVAMDILYVTGIFLIMHISCNKVNFSGISMDNGSVEVMSSCSKLCNCDITVKPICVGQENFLNPCLAGCSNITITNASSIRYENCACVSSKLLEVASLPPTMDANDTLWALRGEAGYCSEDIQKDHCNVWIYVAILGVILLLLSSAKAGNIIITMRTVEKQDKSLAMALVGLSDTVFELIIYPSINGALVDGTCKLRETTTSAAPRNRQEKNCLLFDVDGLRRGFHGITIVCFVVVAIADTFIFHLSRHVKLYEDATLNSKMDSSTAKMQI